jgi:hypothetical protein
LAEDGDHVAAVGLTVRPRYDQRHRRTDGDLERIRARGVEHRVDVIEPLQREDRPRPGILARVQVAVDDDAVDRRENGRARDLGFVLLHRRLCLSHGSVCRAGIGDR